MGTNDQEQGGKVGPEAGVEMSESDRALIAVGGLFRTIGKLCVEIADCTDRQAANRKRPASFEKLQSMLEDSAFLREKLEALKDAEKRRAEWTWRILVALAKEKGECGYAP